MKVLKFLALPLLTLLPSALAECSIDSIQSDLPPYRADRDAAGTVTVNIVCKDDSSQYGLFLGMAAQLPRSGQLVGPRGKLLYQLLPPPQLDLMALRGSQRLVFTVQIPRNQWGAPAGTYGQLFDFRLVARP